MYAEFVTRALEGVYPLMETQTPGCFAEGGCEQTSCPQDYAVLRGEKARCYLALLHRNSALLGIDPADYPMQRSSLPNGGDKYPHSCYPKNLRRWMSGTKSRKKKCRVEFAVLVACWAAGWSDTPAADKLLAQIWQESQKAYHG